MSLSQIFFIVDIAGKGKKLIYAYPHQKMELEEFKLKTEYIQADQSEPNNNQVLVEEMVQTFLKNREYCMPVAILSI